MSTAANDGGPAFPIAYQHKTDGALFEQRWPGLSLRDYFAASALQGLVVIVAPGTTPDDAAAAAYRLADAMLRAREASNG